MLERIARTCVRRRGRVVLAWIGVLVAVNVIANGVLGADYRANMSLPDSESREVQRLLETASPNRTGVTAQVVFEADQGVNDPTVRARMEELFRSVGLLDNVDVTSPYSPEGSGQVSDRAPIAFAELQVKDGDWNELTALGDKIERLGNAVDVPGVRIEYGGEMFGNFEMPESEALGLLAAVIILIVAFGSVLAMGLPIGTALFGLGTGVALTVAISNVQAMPDFAPQMTAMIGLGVGIDYALFIVTRFREGLHAGLEPEDATAAAVDTSGRAVLFAGMTVIVSLMGLYVIGLDFVRGLATGAALGVLVMMVGAITLLPALIGFAQRRIEVTTFRGAIGIFVLTVGLLLGVLLGQALTVLVGLVALAFVVVGSFTFAKPLARAIPPRRAKPRDEQLWYRWSRVIQHRPWPAFVAGFVALVLLALPVLSIRLGFGDTGNLKEDQSPRRAYDLLAEGFGPGFNGPLLLATRLPSGVSQAQLGRVTSVLQRTPGVAFASPAVTNRRNAPTAALWRAIPTTSPQDAATTSLLSRLRNEVLPAAERGTGMDIAVTGNVAVQQDFSTYLAGRLPWFFAAVLTLSFLLLMVVFRSVLVPLKAVVMNLLSIGAAYGIVVAVFQWGWGASLLRVGGAPIEPFMPMMLFAIVFGLSMDYEVFLLSRVKEDWDRTGDSHTSVANGLAATARVITAAAAIMVFVFGSFLLESNRVIKLFGAGLATAVLLDATVVRMLLVPATMELLGDRNWWLPRWLDRLLPRVDVEGSMAHLGPAVAPDAVPAGSVRTAGDRRDLVDESV
ncbi:MAG: MMPL family transporter [Actinobacteria bacterium]|nr:MMPL family transporter [Actinomycetota bacterium]